MELIDVIGKWMEAGELRNFIKVWISVSASLCFCYYASKIDPKESSRLLAIVPIIPVICLNLILPLSLHTLHLGISTAFFLCWLGNFKLLMFAFGKGPLSDSSLSVSSFIALACLPIKFRRNSSDHESTTATSQLLQGTKSIWNYALKLLVLVLLLGGYERYYGDQHPWAPWLILVIYCCHLYVAMEIILAVVGGLAGSILGIEIEPPFNEPYLSSSLQDFWGRRWNIMVTRILHPSVYEPVLNISTRFTGRKWASLPAMLSTLARLCWRFLQQPQATWVQLLTAKYGMLGCHVGQLKRPTSSHTWKSILQGYEAMKEGIDSNPNGQRPGSGSVSWKLTVSSRFTSNSMWQMLTADQQIVTGSWGAVWKFKGPSNPSFTLWLAKKMRLLTMEQLFRRQIVAHVFCPLCGLEPESNLHALRDCTRPRQTWKLFLAEISFGDMFWSCTSMDQWISFNLSRPSDSFNQFHGWSYIFRETIHTFWRNRNLELYQNEVRIPSPTCMARLILDRIFKLLSAWDADAYS